MPGPIFFAWTDPDVDFDPDVHAVYDERIYNITIEQAEGGFASLKIEVRNPRVGLLAPGRKRWCWLSWEGSTGGPQPIFRGRVVGLPADVINETVILEFVAQPDDYADQQAALAETLKVPPYWDEVWISGDPNDPNTVLEARTQLYHVDRVSLEVSVSDNIDGEDGTEEFTTSDDFYETMSVSYGSAPLTQINVTASANYDQVASGDVDFSPMIASHAGGTGNMIPTMTAAGLVDDWPLPGASIGGGWIVGAGTFAAISAHPTLFVQKQYVTPNVIDMSVTDPVSIGTPGGVVNLPFIGLFKPSTQVLAGSTTWVVDFPINTVNIGFVGHYDADRKRSEIVEFRLLADVQQIVSNTGGSDIESLDLTTQDGAIAAAGFDVSSPSFFKTDRGQLAFQYLVALARAHVLDRARCVDVTFDTTWERGLAITCRKNGALFDDRLPGGAVIGKVKGYKLSYSVDNVGAEITIGCTVGHGGSTTAAAGAGDYVDDDYVDDGYQPATGAQLDVVTGEIVYDSFDEFVIDDDGVDLHNMTAANCLAYLHVTGTLAQQNADISTGAALNPPDPIGQVKADATTITLQTVSVKGGPFVTTFPVGDLTLKVPKTYDSEAAAL